MVRRENKNNAYAKFGGQTKSIMVFSELAYISFTLQSSFLSEIYCNFRVSYTACNLNLGL